MNYFCHGHIVFFNNLKSSWEVDNYKHFNYKQIRGTEGYANCGAYQDSPIRIGNVNQYSVSLKLAESYPAHIMELRQGAYIKKGMLREIVVQRSPYWLGLISLDYNELALENIKIKGVI
jgi:hypothetical protein